jgi:hypothetical protein
MANSRYPNMSYCMMENTQLALDQVLDHMREALDEGPEAVRDFMLDLSQTENRAFRELFQACEQFMQLGEQFYEMQYTDDHQPTEADEWASYDADC